MNKDEVQKKIAEDEDYIRCPKFNNSLNKFISKNSEGVESNVIARLLMIPEENVKEIYEKSIDFLKKNMQDE